MSDSKEKGKEHLLQPVKPWSDQTATQTPSAPKTWNANMYVLLLCSGHEHHEVLAVLAHCQVYKEYFLSFFLKKKKKKKLQKRFALYLVPFGLIVAQF